ncbi:hypothetical protein HanXRQr2_Chr06g0250081 [Helianthus annuus]|uniref:Uncharacterized protein n=1 Tax=Helianthus annuus TaxID=4232 RepID=A0A9K3NJA2_HELAN|nr:hypothetical protein HanXRQr2_Chr06g0250081 [Helianthus annuus]
MHPLRTSVDEVVELVGCVPKSLANSGGSQTTKLLLEEVQETTLSVAGSSTIS